MIWRYALAFILSVLVLIGFQRYFEGQRPPPRKGVEKQVQVEEVGRPAFEPERPRAPRREGDGTQRGDEDTDPSLRFADLPIVCKWSEDGRLLSVAIRTFRPRPQDTFQVWRFLVAPADRQGPLAIALRGNGDADGSWEPVGGWLLVEEPETVSGRWVHEARQEGSWKIIRTTTVARIPKDRVRRGGQSAWHLNVRVRIENLGNEPRELQYRIWGPSGFISEAEDDPGADIYLAYGVRDDRKVVSRAQPAGDLTEVGWQAGDEVSWVGGLSGPFLGALYPHDRDQVVGARARPLPAIQGDDRAHGFLSTSLLSARRKVVAGGSLQGEYGLYLGPRSRDSLAGYASLDLAGANVFRVDVSSRHSLVVDTSNGSIRAFYLREFDRKPGGEPGDRVDYRLLEEPLRGVGALGLEVYDAHWRRKEPSLGFSRFPWVLRTKKKPGGFSDLVLEQSFDEILIRKHVSATLREDCPSTLAGEGAGNGESDDAHHLRLRIEVINRSSLDRSVFYSVLGPSAIDSAALRMLGSDIYHGYGKWTGAAVPLATVRAASGLPVESDAFGGETLEEAAWVGLINNYFAAVLFPRSPGDDGPAEFVDSAFASAFADPDDIRRLAQENKGGLEGHQDELAEKAYKNMRTGFTSHELRLAPGSTVRHDYGFFAGPRRKEIFSDYDKIHLEGINDYGSLSFLVRFFISLLEGLKVVGFGSWGIAIILLTFCVKLCLHPINRRSQRSMMRFQKQMQKVKPEMDQIKERHGSDRMAMNREMQALWKKHGINPAQQMAGCLIIFLQLPIWIGLYRTLEFAIGLRQSSFLYIDDLTKPDAIWFQGLETVGVAYIPFIGSWLGSHLNLLPILYVILTVINQRLQPRPTDPQMQTQFRMMTFMMIFFGFIFYKFPAGFMLYIMTSAALGIIESKIIKAQIKREDEAGGLATAGSPSGSVGPAYPAKPKTPKAAPHTSRKKKGKRHRR